MEAPEIGVHSRRVKHENTGGQITGVAEGVGLASGHSHEIAGASDRRRLLEVNGDGTLQDEEGFRAVRVPVRGRRHGGAT